MENSVQATTTANPEAGDVEAATDVYHLLLQDMARYAADASGPNEVLLTPKAFLTQDYGE